LPPRPPTPRLPFDAPMADLVAACEASGMSMQHWPGIGATLSDRNIHDLVLVHLDSMTEIETRIAQLEAECPGCAKAAMAKHDIALADDPTSIIHGRWVLAASRRLACAHHETGTFARHAPARE
jgi:hypothetical protein